MLSTNVLFGVQSVYMKEDGLTGMYYDYAMAAPLMVPDKEPEDLDVLILGMGTGTYATQCRKYFGDMSIEGVEIDGKITELSRKYFSLQMSSVEFFSMVKEHLTENGVMVVNMNMRGQGEGNINQYLSDTIASVFGNVYTADVRGTTNRELFASDNDAMLEVLKSNTAGLTNGDLRNLMTAVADQSQRYEAGEYLMTDDKAPVELLGMQVIDQLIQDEVAYYKEIYRRDGLQGLISQLG